jgi:hypothetical protein
MSSNFSMTLPKTPVDADGKALNPEWRNQFIIIQAAVNSIGISGATTARPTTGLYVGFMYFDTTLGYPVFCSQVTPSIEWVNSQGDTA